MKRLIYSDCSLADLASILDFIARDKPKAAIAFAEKLIETCELIVQHPEIGMSREDLGNSLRVFSHRSYGIYYRNLDDRVRVERILHSSLDVESQSFD